MKYTVQIINESSIVTDAELTPIVAALQIQVSRDFAPLWNADATLEQLPKGTKADPAKWWLSVFDTSDDPGALGYHDLTPQGQPTGKVFAADDKKYGDSLSVTLSHELLEMLGDPDVNTLTMNESEARVYCYESADAVEADSLGYEINGVLVSDFVTRDWFCHDAPASALFDFKGHCTKPFQVLPGGYIGYLDLNNPTAGWQQITMDGHDVAARKPYGSRFEKRERLRKTGQLIQSTAHAA